MDFKDRVVMVTGGAGNLGRAVAAAFVEAGAQVIIADRVPQERGAEVAHTISAQGLPAAFYSAQLGEVEEVKALAQQVDKAYGALHVLVNCAGGGERTMGVKLDTSPIDRWNWVCAGNLLSTYLVTTYCLEMMKRTGGSIINFSSTADVHGNYGLYGVMKSGVDGFTRTMAVEGAPFGIRVNAIAPGWIKTKGTLTRPDDPEQIAWEKNSASLLGRMGRPDEIASVVMFLASEMSSFITGTVIDVDGGLTIIDPSFAGWKKALGLSVV